MTPTKYRICRVVEPPRSPGILFETGPTFEYLDSNDHWWKDQRRADSFTSVASAQEHAAKHGLRLSEYGVVTVDPFVDDAR